MLAFPPGRGYLVMQGDRAGPVVAEIGPYDRTRRLSVRPDRYFVRGRGPGYLLEGTVALAAGEARTVEDRDLERLEYARLVRKGRADATVAAAQGPQAGYELRSPLGGATFCQGVFAGYGVETRHLTADYRELPLGPLLERVLLDDDPDLLVTAFNFLLGADQSRQVAIASSILG